MKNSLLMAVLLNAVFVFAQDIKLNLASDVWPPFTDVAPKPAFALDLVHEALARTNVQAKTDIRDFKDVISSIAANKFDGSAALWHSPEREKLLLFSEPYLENRLILVGKKGSNVSAHGLADLAGKRVAIVESYAYGSFDDARKVKFLPGFSDQQNVERLLRGEVDYMLVDALLIEYLLKYQSEDAARYLEIGNNTMLRLPLYFAVRRDLPGAEKIIDNFNSEIGKMMAEGTYNRILQLNWIAYDYDGDGLQELVLSGDYAGTSAPKHSYGVRTNPSTNSVQVNRFVVAGNIYPTWESVPDKYKQPEPGVSESDKIGFGPVFRF